MKNLILMCALTLMFNSCASSFLWDDYYSYSKPFEIISFEDNINGEGIALATAEFIQTETNVIVWSELNKRGNYDIYVKCYIDNFWHDHFYVNGAGAAKPNIEAAILSSETGAMIVWEHIYFNKKTQKQEQYIKCDFFRHKSDPKKISASKKNACCPKLIKLDSNKVLILYFQSTNQNNSEYDLVSIEYDIENNKWLDTTTIAKNILIDKDKPELKIDSCENYTIATWIEEDLSEDRMFKNRIMLAKYITNWETPKEICRTNDSDISNLQLKTTSIGAIIIWMETKDNKNKVRVVQDANLLDILDLSDKNHNIIGFQLNLDVNSKKAQIVYNTKDVNNNYSFYISSHDPQEQDRFWKESWSTPQKILMQSDVRMQPCFWSMYTTADTANLIWIDTHENRNQLQVSNYSPELNEEISRHSISSRYEHVINCSVSLHNSMLFWSYKTAPGDEDDICGSIGIKTVKINQQNNKQLSTTEFTTKKNARKYKYIETGGGIFKSRIETGEGRL